jgi:hypothetical protein
MQRKTKMNNMKTKGYSKGGAMKTKGYSKGGKMKTKGYAKGGQVNMNSDQVSQHKRMAAGFKVNQGSGNTPA